MNPNNTGAYPILQRRRRRSDQISPSSPSYPRRFLDRTNRHSDAFSPAGSTPATDASESPSLNLNLTFSSPLFDQATPLSSAPTLTRPSAYEPKHQQRSSEEDGRSRYRSSDESTRPATSGTSEHNNASAISVTRSPLLGSDSIPRQSPLTPYSSQPQSRERKILDPPIKVGDNASSPNLRNYSFSTQISDRSAHEDQIPAKAQAGKKSRLNLLMNPMNLLARRRFSQNQKLDDTSLSINTLSVPALPDNFDPSIRGKVVHDFSLPRTRRLYSHNDVGAIDSPQRSGHGFDPIRVNDPPGSSKRPPSGTPNFSHSPMFKEHFQDDRPALQPERTGYLHNIHAFNMAHDQHDPEDVPTFARRLPSAVPQPGRELDIDPDLWRKENKPLPPEKDREHTHASVIPEPSPPPPTPPPKSTPSPKFDIPPPAALPKHMTSTSSRFSFQIGGSGSSAQEKLLEEKHKEHEATRKISGRGLDEEEDDFDYDFDADDGFEERIPGVNADFEEDDGFGNDDVTPGNALVARYGPSADFEEDDGVGNDDGPLGNALVARYDPPEIQEAPELDVKTTALQRQSLQGFHFTPQSLTFSPTSTTNASQPTPRDHEGFAIGIADSRAPSQDALADFQPKEEVIDVEKVPMLGGLGISTAEIHGRRTQQTSRPHGGVFDDEDLYFNDGEFDPLEIDSSGPAFDERLFDDDAGQLRDIPAGNARKFEAAKQAAGVDADAKVVNNWQNALGRLSLNTNVQRHGSDSKASSLMEGPLAGPGPAVLGEPMGGLTETNLAAYHDALALAANQAAANGRFDRKVSFSQNSDDTSQSPFESSQPGVVSDGSRFSYNYGSAIAEDDGFPFDDDMDDDLMIAEANAEALENDDDGFYGQEFGFYARARSKDNTELINGGYFSERGSNGVKRSHSGKANFQEPSLTPITERSEWSTRNSVVSLQIPGMPSSAQSIPSPGIAHLRELDSPAYDEDMSFTALMKLRGRAFGGSSSSINSSGAGFSATSPRVHMGNNPFAHSDHSGSRMASSIHGRVSPAGIPESEEEEEAERPTLTQNTPRKKISEPVVVTSQEEMPSPPGSAGGDRRKGHHSRTSSGAESVVSYARDSDGGWVLERRRTDEGSGTEVIDREYLGGGRI
jgi:hypothetical protein